MCSREMTEQHSNGIRVYSHKTRKRTRTPHRRSQLDVADGHIIGILQQVACVPFAGTLDHRGYSLDSSNPARRGHCIHPQNHRLSSMGRGGSCAEEALDTSVIVLDAFIAWVLDTFIAWTNSSNTLSCR
jgi:hypothetical protein